MAAEVAISFSSLRSQLENEKSSLYKLDENIKKIVQTSGRFHNDRFNFSGDYSRGGNRLATRNLYPDTGKNEDTFGKRKHETKTVFSRLSGRQESDGEEEGLSIKRTRVSSAVSRELPTRASVLRAQGGDEQARTRNRRIFGSLLGTLQKFKQEEIGLQDKEEKRAQVERKIEEQAKLQKEREQKERKTLFKEREQKKAMIKALEAKMLRVQEFEKWEASQKDLGNFILTKAKPHIFWIPKKMSEKTEEKLTSCRMNHEKQMSKKREELQQELQRIEQRCLRTRPETKENQLNDTVKTIDDDEKGKTRDKFVTDGNEKMEDSDGEERHDENVDLKSEQEHVQNENKMDTSEEQDTVLQTEDINRSQNSEIMETDNDNQPETLPEVVDKDNENSSQTEHS